jgi:predicted phage baseplate assembly protein
VEVTETPGRFEPTLARQPITHRQEPPAGDTPAARVLAQDPRQALPVVTLTEASPDGDDAAAVPWTPRAHLLDSGPDATEFVVEIDNDGRGHLRFGDGDLGRQPEARASFSAHYRVGGGVAGNVGADSITEIVLRRTKLTGVALAARNPLPAAGGVAPEPVDEVKQLAPGAFRRVIRRAITADDYAALAVAPDGVPSTVVQGAAAALDWTGSWYEADVAVDPFGVEGATPALLAGVETALAPFRRIRHDVRALQARYVPLDVALTVCVAAHHAQRDVVATVLDVLGGRRRADGGLGFFHPDALRFGEPVFVSRLVGAVQAVPGVTSVVIDRLRRLFDPAPAAGVSAVPEDGVLRMQFLEIAQLDNDPNEVENGRLTVTAQGGR